MVSMGKTSSNPAGPPDPKRGRRPSAGAGGPADRGRWSSQRKMEAVLRVLKGEDLDALSRELKVSTARLAAWRDEFLSAGQSGLKSREPDARAEEIQRLRAKVGELTMDLELYEHLVDRLEPEQRPPSRRPRP
jgi:transposase